MPIAQRVFNGGEHNVLIVGAARIPGEREHPVEVRAQDLVFTGRRREHAQPFRFTARLSPDLLGKLGLVDTAQQVHRLLFVRVGLTEL